MVVAPLARLAARHVRAGRDVVPPVRPVIDRVQQEPLVRWILTQIWPRWIEERVDHAEPGLPVAGSVTTFAQEPAEPEKTLSRDCRRRTIDWLAIVERISGPAAPVTERQQSRRSRIPVGHTVCTRGGFDVKVARGPRRVEHPGDRLLVASFLERVARQRREKLELLGKAEHRPRQSARPGRERGVAL